MFHRAKDIITKKTSITLISTPKSIEMLKSAAQIHAYKVVDERTVFEGQDELVAIKFQQE